MTENVHAAGLQSRLETLEGFQVQITSYQVGRFWSCRVDNVDPGANIARGRGETRDEAEESALESAALTLAMRRSRRAIDTATKALGGDKK